MLCRRQTQTLDFLSRAHRADGAGGDSDRPALLSLIAPDALLCAGSRTSSRSCLPSLCSLSSILSFGLGARRSCEETAAEECLCRGLLAPTSLEPGSILFLTRRDTWFANPYHVTRWLVKNLTFFTQGDTISFPAVVFERISLPRCGEEPLLQCGGRGLQAPRQELGCPDGLGGWFRASLKSKLKIRDGDAALFLSQGSALPSISPKMCGFTSVPTTNTLVNFRQSWSFFFVGM